MSHKAQIVVVLWSWECFDTESHQKTCYLILHYELFYIIYKVFTYLFLILIRFIKQLL